MNRKKRKQRLDLLMVERGLCETQQNAQAQIVCGDVVVGDHRMDKPGTLVANDVEIRIKGIDMPYVSRGGFKLAKAIELWPTPITNAVCIDVGASTGGFTDVLLQNGAQKVYAVDVGYGQIDWKLRQDPRVANFERTHIVKVPVGTFDPAPSIAVIDVSFISLTSVLPAVLPHLTAEATLYVLIKPQFEARREQVEQGGMINDPAVRLETVQRVIACAESLGLILRGYTESPITGTDGNVEYIAALKKIPA